MVPWPGSVDLDSSREESPGTRSLLGRDPEQESAGQNNNREENWSSHNPDRQGSKVFFIGNLNAKATKMLNC